MNEPEKPKPQPISRDDYAAELTSRVERYRKAVGPLTVENRLRHCVIEAQTITELVRAEDQLAAVMAAQVLVVLVDDVREELRKRIRDGKLMLEENGLIT